MPIRCEIVSQDRMVFEGDVDIVVLPGAAGEMGVLPHHVPLLTTLKYGFVKVRMKGREEIFAVAGGVAEVQPDIVTVLADAAENVKEIDAARAEDARKRAEAALKKLKPDSDAYTNFEGALRRSHLRLDAVKRYRSGARTPYNKE
ncbi:MAG: F0F1 ATP synthase subunit epsilon [Anaerolineales bacterium]